MTTKELSQYRSIKKEILEIQKEIESYKVSDTVTSSAEFPYTPHTVTIEGYTNKSGLNRLRNRRNILIKQKNEIEEYVDNIDDSIMRQIFKYRYIVEYNNGKIVPMAWRLVANKINEYDESYPRKKHTKYLERHT